MAVDKNGEHRPSQRERDWVVATGASVQEEVFGESKVQPGPVDLGDVLPDRKTVQRNEALIWEAN